MRSRHAGDAARPSGSARVLSEHRNTVASFAGGRAAAPSWTRLQTPPSGASPLSLPEVYGGAGSTDTFALDAAAGAGPLRLGMHVPTRIHRFARDRYLVWDAPGLSRFGGRAAIREFCGGVMAGDGPFGIGADPRPMEGASGGTIAHGTAAWSHRVARTGIACGSSRWVCVRNRGAPDYSGCGLE